MDIFEDNFTFKDPEPEEVVLHKAYEALKRAYMNGTNIVPDEDRQAVKELLYLDGFIGPDIISSYFEKLEDFKDEKFRRELDTVVELFKDKEFIFNSFPGLDDHHIPDFIERFKRQTYEYMEQAVKRMQFPTAQQVASIHNITRLATDTRLPMLMYYNDFTRYGMGGLTGRNAINLGFSRKAIDIFEGNLILAIYSTMDKMNIDTAWDSDVLFIFMQLKSNHELFGYDSQSIQSKVLNYKLKTFVGQKCSPEEVKHALETVNTIAQDYKTTVLDDPEKQKEFVNAYKKIYLSELLSGKQTAPEAHKTDFLVFALRQMPAFISHQDETQINTRVLLSRTVQDLMTKEIQNHINVLPKGIKEPKNRLILTDMTDIIAGFQTSPVYGITLFNTTTYCKSNIMMNRMAQWVYMELDRRFKEIESQSGAFHDYTSYKAIKYQLIERHRPEVKDANEYSSPNEYSANLYGIIKGIQAAKDYPAGKDTNSELERMNNALKSAAKTTPYSELTTYITGLSEGRKRTDVYLEDRIVSKIAPELKDTVLGEILGFEYHRGKPKSLEEIIHDQEQELANPETELIPPAGPTNPIERVKLRFQIMMDRAIECNREADCYNLIRKFMLAHQDILKKDEILSEVLPENPLEYKGLKDEREDHYLGLESEESVTIARYYINLHRMMDSMIEKSKNSQKTFPTDQDDQQPE